MLQNLTKLELNGKTGVLGDAVTITRDKTKLQIAAVAPFSKRYLKYLTKKYLKKQQLRDYLHVIASNKTTYELRYFNIHDNDADDDGVCDADEGTTSCVSTDVTCIDTYRART